MRNFVFSVALAVAITGCSSTAAASAGANLVPVTTKSLVQGTPGFAKGSFQSTSIKVMDLLMRDLGLTATQAAGVVGNLAHESGGFAIYQEQAPVAGRGGAGWAQWTGPRRRAFERWAAGRGLELTSFEANYGFLKHELETSYTSSVAAVKATRTLDAAMRSFENNYERAGVKHYPSRKKWAERAYAAWVASRS